MNKRDNPLNHYDVMISNIKWRQKMLIYERSKSELELLRYTLSDKESKEFVKEHKRFFKMIENKYIA